jgi:DNA-binding SARP family transcriptional activator/tetratricopeptide (TPR) repeat protein
VSARPARAARAARRAEPAAAPTPPSLDIRLLGPVVVHVDGRPIDVDTRKAVALLAFLAVTRRQASRETLAALLWPDAGEQEARGALRRTLSVLNAGLGSGRLSIERHAVALRDGDLSVDIHRFADLVGEARRHGHPPDRWCATCESLLEEAADLDRGELMAGFTLRDSDAWDEWQLTEAEGARREQAAMLERLARITAAGGRWDRTVAVARRWLEVDPLHEPAHRLLIEAHGRAGEPAAAIAQYRACVRILATELGVAPLPETTALYEAVRDGALGPELSRGMPPAGVSGTAGGTAIEGPRTLQRLTKPLPMAGRTNELERLLSLLELDDGAGGAVAVVIGQAGVGKTRLLDALTDAVAASGGRVLAARAWPGETGIPFGPIAGLLKAALARVDGAAWVAGLEPAARAAMARLVPNAGFDFPDRGGTAASTVAGPSDRIALLEGIADALSSSADTSAHPPTLVRVDDVQWADPSSVEALGYLARRVDRRRVIIALAWRPEDVGSTASTLATITRLPAAVVIRLEPLDPQAIAELVRAVRGPAASAEAIDELVRESEGLPLFLAEALAAGEIPTGSIPPGVRALLDERLAAVGDVEGQVLGAAAVVGRWFDPDLVRQASGRSDDETVAALEALVRRGLIRESAGEGTPDGYDFASSRVRDLAYGQLGLARRRLLHRRVADAIRTTPGSTDALARLSLLAEHERAGGRPVEAAGAYLRAGEQARAVFANQEALAAFEAASSLGHPDELGLALAIGDVRTRLGDYPGALASLEAAAAIAAADRLASIERMLGRIQLRRGDLVAADSHLRAAIAALDPMAPVARRSELLADRSVVAHRRADHAAASDLARQALDLVDPATDPAAAATAHRLLGLVARAAGDLDEAHVELVKSADLAVRAGEIDAVVAADHALALVELANGDFDAALARANSALTGATRSGDRHVEAAVENTLADILHALGRETESRDHLRRAVVLFAGIGASSETLEPEIWKFVEW